MDDEMTESGKVDVLVLDIRVSGEDSAWLDGLTLDNAHETDVADRVVFMENGRIVEIGTPEQLFERPRSERTRQFLSSFHAA